MGLLTAQALINEAAIQLKDTGNTRWTRTELLGWLNQAQRTLGLAVPEVTAVTVNVPTVAGHRQSIPADGWLFLRATRNMGPTGTTIGRALEPTSFEVMTANNPLWTSDAATNTAVAYMFTPLERNVFWIYPPAAGSGNQIEVLYSRVLASLTAETQNISVPDVYESALLDYMMYRALSKDGDEAELQAAGMYFTSFRAALGAGQSSATATPSQGSAA